MSAWLRVVLAAQILFFSVWGASLLRSHAHVRVVWLATQPIDPRDLLSGHYVALRYPIETPSTPDCQALLASADAAPIYVQLADAGPPIVTSEGAATVSHAVACRRDPPPGVSGGTWIEHSPRRAQRQRRCEGGDQRRCGGAARRRLAAHAARELSSSRRAENVLGRARAAEVGRACQRHCTACGEREPPFVRLRAAETVTEHEVRIRRPCRRSGKSREVTCGVRLRRRVVDGRLLRTSSDVRSYDSRALARIRMRLSFFDTALWLA